MYFEGRELSSFSEPVTHHQLKVGEVYFIVGFIDDHMHVPTMEAYVFIGRNLQPEDHAEYYFQDFSSHKAGITYDSSSPDDAAEFLSQSEDELGLIFDYEYALNELLKCSLRRKQAGK